MWSSVRWTSSPLDGDLGMHQNDTSSPQGLVIWMGYDDRGVPPGLEIQFFGWAYHTIHSPRA